MPCVHCMLGWFYCQGRRAVRAECKQEVAQAAAAVEVWKCLLQGVRFTCDMLTLYW